MIPSHLGLLADVAVMMVTLAVEHKQMPFPGYGMAFGTRLSIWVIK